MNTQKHEKDSSPNLAQQQQPQQQQAKQPAPQAQQAQAQNEAQAVQAQRATQKAQSAQQASVGAELSGAKGGAATQAAPQAGKSKAQANAEAKDKGAAGAKPVNPGAPVQTTPAQEEKTVNNFSKSRDEQHADKAKNGDLKDAQGEKKKKSQDGKGKSKKDDKKDALGAKKEDKNAKKEDKGAKKEDKGDKKDAQGAKKEDKNVSSKETSKKDKSEQSKADAKHQDGASKQAGSSANKSQTVSASAKADDKKGNNKKGNDTKGDKKESKKPGKASHAATGSVGGGISVSISGGGSGGGDAGGGGGGGIALPAIGAGAPAAPAPKGEGSGKNAVEAFATSGLSHQLEHHAELGPKTQEDIQKSETEKKTKLPGEEEAEINDGSVDAEKQASNEASKATNEGNKEITFESKMNANLEAAGSDASAKIKAQKISGGGDDIPNEPTVEADTSSIDEAKAEETEKYNQTKSEGVEKVSSLDKTLPERGYDDLKLPKSVLDEQEAALETSAIAMAAELEQFHEESKGILDFTQEAESTSAQMQEASAQVDSAEAETDAQIDASVAEHEAEIEQIRADAKTNEDEQMAALETEMNSQIDEQSAEFESEAAGYDAEHQGYVTDARSQVEQGKRKAQRDIKREKQNADKEKKSAEENDKKEEKAWYEKLADAAKDAAKRFVSGLKALVSKIINKFLEAVNNLLDTFADLVSKVNKDLGNKLRTAFDKFKKLLKKFADNLIKIINAVLDKALEIFTTIVDATVEAINAAVEAFKELIAQILETLREAYRQALSTIKAALESLANIAVAIFKKACEFCGVDPAPMLAAAANILKDPGAFFSTLWAGIKQGFSQFVSNMPANLMVIAQNLLSMWLGGSGLKGIDELPQIRGFIQLIFSLMGIDVSKVLKPITAVWDAYQEHKKAAEEEAKAQAEPGEKVEEIKDPPEAVKLKNTIDMIMAGGLPVIADLIKDGLGGLKGEILSALFSSLVPPLIGKAVAKLAAMANPVGGIIAAIKAVWDTVQFFRSQFDAIAGLGSALLNVLVEAGNGNAGAAANAVEAAICQAIPLAIEILLRVIGINIGAKVKGVISKFSTRVKTGLDKYLSKFKLPTFDSVQKNKERKKKQDKAKSKEVAKTRDKQARSGSRTAALGSWGAKQSNKISAMKEAKEESRFDFTGLTGALQGKKDGNLGINIENLKSTQAADKYHKEREDKKELAKLLENPEQSRKEVLKKQAAQGSAKAYDEGAKLTDAEKQLLHITALQSAEEKKNNGQPLNKEEQHALKREAKNKMEGKPTEIPPALKPKSDSSLQNLKDSTFDFLQGAAGGSKAAGSAAKEEMIHAKDSVVTFGKDAAYLAQHRSIKDLKTKKRLEKNRKDQEL